MQLQPPSSNADTWTNKKIGAVLYLLTKNCWFTLSLSFIYLLELYNSRGNETNRFLMFLMIGKLPLYCISERAITPIKPEEILLTIRFIVMIIIGKPPPCWPLGCSASVFGESPPQLSRCRCQWWTLVSAVSAVGGRETNTGCKRINTSTIIF